MCALRSAGGGQSGVDEGTCMVDLRYRLLLGGLVFVLGLSVFCPAQVRAPQRVRVSGKAAETFIEHKVPPAYPEEARKKHIQGAVVMQVEISKGGEVESLKVIPAIGYWLPPPPMPSSNGNTNLTS